MNDLIERLRAVKWEEADDGERAPDDPTHKCVFVDMRPDDFRALLREAADALEAAREDKSAGAWNSVLQCTWLSWRALSSGEIALDMPAYCCCDMRGAIRVAESLMPGVWRIATFAGGVPDTEYRNVYGVWKAYDPSARR